MEALLPFRVEYAETSLIICEKCKDNINIGSIKIGIMQESIQDDCLEAVWFDVSCFFLIRQPRFEDYIDGFFNLRIKDQVKLRSFLNDENNTIEPYKEQIDQQNDSYFAIYDKLKTFNSHHLNEILMENRQFVPENYSEKLNHTCDVLMFGALSPCPVCKDGRLLFQNSIYRCTGYDSPWTKCVFSTKQPPRVPIDLPVRYKHLLGTFNVGTRILRNVRKFNHDEFRMYTKQPLSYMEFFIIGETNYPRNVIENKIRAMGGVLASKIHPHLLAVISNADVVNGRGEVITDVFERRIQVISDELLDRFLENDPIDLIAKSDLSSFGIDPYERMPGLKTAFKVSNQRDKKSTFEKYPKKYRVYCEPGIRYETMLDFVDISINKNSYCKLQIDDGFLLTQKKGRINYDSFGFITEKQYMSINEAKREFMKIFSDLTGNEFGAKNFEKKPGKYNLVKIDYDILNRELKNNNVQTKLSKPLYNLMEMVFSGNALRSTLLDFSLIFDDMPLGKICLGFNEATALLKDLEDNLKSGNSRDIIAATNRFYSYFPQDWGRQPPRIIDTYTMIDEKNKMLHKIMDRNAKYKELINPSNKTRNLLDVCYEHLKDSAEIKILNKNTKTYRQIVDYVMNTQLLSDDTPRYKLKVDEIFEVERHEELIRYQPHEENFNRQLLFHGTHIENILGILTNGLKLVPLTSHFSGSALGNGLYFADSATKSAPYCRPDPIKKTGLLLLCEVAAGRTDFRYNFSVVEMKKFCESVQAIGKWKPSTMEISDRHKGLKIPNGKLIKDTDVGTNPLFNEFVLFDESRVKIRYLVKIKFKFIERARQKPELVIDLPPPLS